MVITAYAPCIVATKAHLSSVEWRRGIKSEAVRGHLGLRISDSESKKPSNVRMRLVDILTFNGSSSLSVAAGIPFQTPTFGKQCGIQQRASWKNMKVRKLPNGTSFSVHFQHYFAHRMMSDATGIEEDPL